RLYGSAAGAQPARCLKALRSFLDIYGERAAPRLFSAPGRAEIGGNHTDHQGGRVLAAAVTLDILAVVAPSRDGLVRIKSDGYPMLKVHTRELAPKKHERGGSHALVRGVADGLRRAGFRLGGFDAFMTSEVPKGSGLSSSAAFGVLVGSIFSGLYNGGAIPPLALAQAARHAENRYFGKPSGLMDQLAAAEGGFTFIDFADAARPRVRRIERTLRPLGWTLCIVAPGGGHARLTHEYAAIPADMDAVAAQFKKPHLSSVREEDFYQALGSLRGRVGDRALLRAMHFFSENARVPAMAEALEAGDMPRLAALLNASGESSFKRLQNIWPAAPQERSLALALALSERLLAGRGAWRVHGGGFAGTILALMPAGALPDYAAEMTRVFGEGCCYPLEVRPAGGAELLPG
ncbi:MAG: galactokinase family protein, partial [Clostridia bacterium]|nr:galactokinase family protein [Clostridia bacterium]